MDRLTCLIALFTASVCGSVCSGQEASPFTIAGDVRAPGNHFFQGWQQVDLADLLHRAHPLSESGNAVILRGQPLVVVTSVNIHQNRQTRPTALRPGDIVMFRRFEGGPSGDGTAVVAHGGIPTVVSLPGGPLPLFEVLESLQIQTSQPVALVRAEWGELQASMLNQNELVQHGDVLNLTLPDNGRQFAQTPMVSESADGFRRVLNNANLSRTVAHEGAEESGDSTIEMPDPPDAFQEQPVYSGTPPLIVPGLNSEESTSDQTAEQESTIFASSTLTLPEDSDQPDSVTREEQNNSDTAAAAFHNASLQRTAELPGTSANQDPASKPNAESASNGVWNGIFVVGLLMAMTLIVAGWIKTGQERRMEELDQVVAQGHSEAVQHPKPVVPATPANDNTSPADTWHSDMFSEPITVYSNDVNSQHDYLSQPETSEDRVMFADTEIEAAEIAELLAADDLQSTNASIEESESRELTNPEVTNPELVQTPAPVNRQQAVSETTATTVDPLDDLIYNRLPLELSQTQLPLQIALYGRPDGPRRLRIDAAHSQIAPPHMAAVERRAQRREPVTARQQKSTQTSQHSERARAHYQTDSSASKAPPAAKPPGEDVSRFDRALNFLEEQSER